MYSGRCVSKLVFQGQAWETNFFQDTLSRKDAHRVKLGLWSYLEGSYRWPHNFFITNLYIPFRWGATTSRNHFSSYPRREDVVDLMHSAYTSKVAISGIASLELGVADGDSDVGYGLGQKGCPPWEFREEGVLVTCLACLADLVEGCKKSEGCLVEPTHLVVVGGL